MLNVRYDPVARIGRVRLRDGRAVRTRRLSEQAVAEYDRRNRLLSIEVTDLDERAAEFLRTADEDTLLQVIRMQAGASKAGSTLHARDERPRPRAGAERDRKPKPRSAPAKPAAKPPPKPVAKAEAAPAPATEAGAEAPKRKRRRRRRPHAASPGEGATATEAAD